MEALPVAASRILRFISVLLKWLAIGIAALVCIIIALVILFYVVISIKEYRYLLSCDSQGSVQSDADAIKVVREAAKGWDELQKLGVRTTPNPDGSFSDGGKFHSFPVRDSWGFIHYYVTFSSMTGVEVHFFEIDKCGHYYPDSVRTLQ